MWELGSNRTAGTPTVLLNGHSSTVLYRCYWWTIHCFSAEYLGLCSYTTKLAALCQWSIQFKCAPREATQAAHDLTSWSFKNKYLGYFVLGFAPLVFCDVLALEQGRIGFLALVSSSFVNKTFLLKKRV